jgi:cytochrome o ubiquinol oxidase subunit 1
MVIGGVLFGFFAGLTYWFPKIFGFTLNERLGRYAFWSWVIGFLLAFVPLYILGIMGMTRRLDFAAPQWHPLLVVAAVGACIIGLALFFQVLQMIVSIWQRKAHKAGGDPWNGRTLEWSTSSPPPFYNFAHLPVVEGRDPWWKAKQEAGTNTQGKEGETWPSPAERILFPEHSQGYKDITLPKDTPLGFIIAGFSFAFGFGMIWHIWWLAALGVVGAIALLIVRSFETEIEYVVPAREVERIEHARK